MNQAFVLKLSQEVIDEIVDFVDQDSLRACATTHRIFLRSCQSRLFSTLNFYSDRIEFGEDVLRLKYNRVNHMLKILHESPHIARYVRGLRLRISTRDNRWVGEDPDFLKVLDLVKQSGSHIKTLKLIGATFPERFFDARLLEKNFLQPFISSSLTTLVISGMGNVPMSLIANSPNLKYLKTFRSSLEGFGDNIDLDLLRCSPKIQHLQYFPQDATIESILVQNTVSLRKKASGMPYPTPALSSNIIHVIEVPPITDLTDLRSITTVIRDLDFLQSIIQLSKHSLEELYLFNQAMYSDNEIDFCAAAGRALHAVQLIDLSEVHRLRILVLDVMFLSSASEYDALEDICTVFKTIPSENCLEEITVNVYVGFQSFSYGPTSAAHQGNWALLDSEITRIACEKALHLHLKIAYQLAESEYWGSDYELRGLWDSVDIQKDAEEMCRNVIEKLVKERLPKIHSSSCITSLDFAYSASDPDLIIPTVIPDSSHSGWPIVPAP